MSVNLRSLSVEGQLEQAVKENPDLKDLLAIYPIEHADKILNNKEKFNKLVKNFNNLMAGTIVNSMIMTCTSTCPFGNICYFKKEGLDPVGSPCPVEKQIIINMEREIVEYLEVDRSNPIEMELLWDLIDTKLLDMRSSAKLKDGTVVQTIESSIGKVTQTREDMSPAILLKIDLKKLKHSIIDSFVATRRAKKKYGMNNDVSSLEQLIKNAAVNINEDS